MSPMGGSMGGSPRSVSEYEGYDQALSSYSGGEMDHLDFPLSGGGHHGGGHGGGGHAGGSLGPGSSGLGLRHLDDLMIEPTGMMDSTDADAGNHRLFSMD